MIVYSTQHHRAKHRVLATFCQRTQISTKIVTSANDTSTAWRIADALSRVTACAAAPLTAGFDGLDPEFPYPDAHVAALLDSAARTMLLETGHSLWYVYVTAELFHALNDLDSAVATVPATARRAVTDEVRTLAESLATRGDPRALTGPRSPLTHGLQLGYRDRARFRNALGGFTVRQQPRLKGSLRDLVRVMRTCTNRRAALDVEFWALSVEYDDYDTHVLEISPPTSDESWTVTICRWVPTTGADPDLSPTLECRRLDGAQIADFVRLFDLASPKMINEWAVTPQGQPLRGTPFVVTRQWTPLDASVPG